MARIVIKGRREPIEIEYERAAKIKNRWLGVNGEEKATKDDILDLGIWSGEYGRIAEIELIPSFTSSQSVEDPLKKYEDEEQKRIAEWVTLTPEQKGSRLSRFKLAYGHKTGKYNEPVPEDILKKAEKIQVDYYKKNPKAFGVPYEAFGDLLPPRTAPTITEKMTMDKKTVLSGKKCICGNPLTLKQEYCSGECLLKDKNG